MIMRVATSMKLMFRVFEMNGNEREARKLHSITCQRKTLVKTSAAVKPGLYLRNSDLDRFVFGYELDVEWPSNVECVGNLEGSLLHLLHRFLI
jgi:hypothetical protein